MKTKTILIVDDDADDREILLDAFLSVNKEMECVLLENGDRLLDYLENKGETARPALVLLDLNMPGMDGRESLKEMKSNPKWLTIPILVFTTSSSPLDKKNSYELGANCFITKPDTFDKLTEIAGIICKLWLQ